MNRPTIAAAHAPLPLLSHCNIPNTKLGRADFALLALEGPNKLCWPTAINAKPKKKHRERMGFAALEGVMD